MTPERRKELEERAREYHDSGARCESHYEGPYYREQCTGCLADLLEAVDREAEERGRREREVLAVEDAVAWSVERIQMREAAQGVVDNASGVRDGIARGELLVIALNAKRREGKASD